MSPTMNLTERLLHALRARGATEVFGIPGDFALPLFGEIERSGVLPLYTLSHEPAVGFAADAVKPPRTASFQRQEIPQKPCQHLADCNQNS